jgi:hypothetical protein
MRATFFVLPVLGMYISAAIGQGRSPASILRTLSRASQTGNKSSASAETVYSRRTAEHAPPSFQLADVESGWLL